MRERVVHDWEDQLRYKKKKGTGNAWDHNLSLGDHHGYTDPHYHFKHRHGSTEVDAVAASLECNDSSAAKARADRCVADYLQNIGWKLTDSAEREIQRRSSSMQ